METIKKSMLIQMYAEKTGMSKTDSADNLQALWDLLTDLMRKGSKVNVTGFGIFKVADRKAREGRNPRTGEVIQIPASKKVRFTPSKVLKEAVL